MIELIHIMDHVYFIERKRCHYILHDVHLNKLYDTYFTYFQVRVFYRLSLQIIIGLDLPSGV